MFIEACTFKILFFHTLKWASNASTTLSYFFLSFVEILMLSSMASAPLPRLYWFSEWQYLSNLLWLVLVFLKKSGRFIVVIAEQVLLPYGVTNIQLYNHSKHCTHCIVTLITYSYKSQHIQVNRGPGRPNIWLPKLVHWLIDFSEPNWDTTLICSTLCCCHGNWWWWHYWQHTINAHQFYTSYWTSPTLGKRWYDWPGLRKITINYGQLTKLHIMLSTNP